MKRIVSVILCLLLMVSGAFADTTTTNYGFVKPSSGSSGWDAKINANYDSIDTTIANVNSRGCLVERTTNLTGMDSSTATVVLWNDAGAEIYDTNAIHDMSTNTGRLTVPSGVTEIRLKAQMVGSGVTGYALYKNGTKLATGGMYVTAGAASPGYAETPRLIVTAGDYFEMKADVGSGGTLGGTVGAWRSWFALEILK